MNKLESQLAPYLEMFGKITSKQALSKALELDAAANACTALWPKRVYKKRSEVMLDYATLLEKAGL